MAIFDLSQGGGPIPVTDGTANPWDDPDWLAKLWAAIPRPPQAGPPGYAGSTGATPPLTPGGDPRGPDVAMNQITGMGGGATNPGYQPPGIVPGRVNPNAPSPAAQPVSAAAPVPGPLAADPRFGTFRYETPNSSANRAPIYTALNLGSLFGGGQPAAAPTTPMPPRRPVAGPLARQPSMQHVPLPPTMPEDIARRRAIQLAAAHSGFA